MVVYMDPLGFKFLTRTPQSLGLAGLGSREAGSFLDISWVKVQVTVLTICIDSYVSSYIISYYNILYGFTFYYMMYDIIPYVNITFLLY